MAVFAGAVRTVAAFVTVFLFTVALDAAAVVAEALFVACPALAVGAVFFAVVGFALAVFALVVFALAVLRTGSFVLAADLPLTDVDALGADVFVVVLVAGLDAFDAVFVVGELLFATAVLPDALVVAAVTFFLVDAVADLRGVDFLLLAVFADVDAAITILPRSGLAIA